MRSALAPEIVSKDIYYGTSFQRQHFGADCIASQEYARAVVVTSADQGHPVYPYQPGAMLSLKTSGGRPVKQHMSRRVLLLIYVIKHRWISGNTRYRI